MILYCTVKQIFLNSKASQFNMLNSEYGTTFQEHYVNLKIIATNAET